MRGSRCRRHPAQDQGAHDPLAQLGFGDQQGAQPVGRDQHRLDRRPGEGVDERRAAGELGELAHERAGDIGDEDAPMSQPVALGDLDLARDDQRQAVPGLADPDQRLAGRIGARRPEAAQPLDLGRLQDRKHLLAAGLGHQGRRVGHDNCP